MRASICLPLYVRTWVAGCRQCATIIQPMLKDMSKAKGILPVVSEALACREGLTGWPRKENW